MSYICNKEPYELVLTSATRESGSYYNGTIRLRNSISGCKEISLQYAAFPNDADLFESDTFTFEESAGGGSTTFTITGSFTAQQMADFLETELNSNSPNGSPNYIYKVEVIGYLNKIRIYNTAAGTFRIDGPNCPARIGFSTLTSYATTHTADNKLRLNPPSVMIVNFRNVTSTNNVSTSKGGTIGNFSIPMIGDSYDIVDFQKGSMYNNPIKIKDNTVIDSFDYQLIDPETGKLWKINSDWTMSLLIK